MRMGIVKVNREYVVDLDDQNMVDEAIECVHEDLTNAMKFDSLHSLIITEEDDTRSANDIPEFLIQEEEDIGDDAHLKGHYA
jgi:hypothetical protein